MDFLVASASTKENLHCPHTLFQQLFVQQSGKDHWAGLDSNVTLMTYWIMTISSPFPAAVLRVVAALLICLTFMESIPSTDLYLSLPPD